MFSPHDRPIPPVPRPPAAPLPAHSRHPLPRLRARSLLTFAAITILSLSSLAAVILINPDADLLTRATKDRSIPTVKPLILDCHFGYQGCHQSSSLLNHLPVPVETRKAADSIGATFGVNPQLLVTLAVLQAQPSDDFTLQSLESIPLTQTGLTAIAQDLKDIAARQNNAPIPTVYQNIDVGAIKLQNLNPASYVIFQYLTKKVNGAQNLVKSVAPPVKNDGQTQGFVEVFQTLFQQDPLRQQTS